MLGGSSSCESPLELPGEVAGAGLPPPSDVDEVQLAQQVVALLAGDAQPSLSSPAQQWQLWEAAHSGLAGGIEQVGKPMSLLLCGLLNLMLLRCC